MPDDLVPLAAASSKLLQQARNSATCRSHSTSVIGPRSATAALPDPP
ncbi:MAG TPA: hypothetical protein VJT31_35865 [Rugosimonospora sp.]|nr:hypothetical protein [Rugosimonospora sp.]